MKKFGMGLLLGCAVVLASPASAQAALTGTQIDAVISLLVAFNVDQKTIDTVRATLRGGAAPAAGSLWFGAAAQPSAVELGRNSDAVPFTTVTLTNNSGASATIYTLTIERAGSASDTSVGEVLLLNGTTVLAEEVDLNTKHQAVLIPKNLTLSNGQSLTLTIAGTTSNSVRSGRTLGLSLVALNASSPVSGVLPLTGVLHTID